MPTPNPLDRAYHLLRALSPRGEIRIGAGAAVWAEAYAAPSLARDAQRICGAAATSASVAVAQLAEELEECVALRLTELRAQARAEHDAAERAAIETEVRDLEARAA